MSTLRTRALALGVALAAFVPVSVLAQSTPYTVSLPTDITAAAGSQFVLPLTVSDGTGASGEGIDSFFLSISYDPTKVSYIDYKPGPSFKDFDFEVDPIDVSAGVQELVFGAVNPDAPATGDGNLVLAELTFSVKSTASGDVAFTLSNNQDDLATAELVNGRVRIGAPVAAVSSVPAVSAAPTAAPSSAPTAAPSSVSSAPEVSEVPSSVEPSSVAGESGSDGPDGEDLSATPDTALAPDALNETGPVETVMLLGVALVLAAGLQFLRRTA